MLKHTRYIQWSITLWVILVLILSGCAPASTGSSGGETIDAAPTTAGTAPANAAPAAGSPTAAGSSTASGSPTASGSGTASDAPQATSGIPNSGSTAESGSSSGGAGQTSGAGQTGVQYVIVPDKSEANYRVREQLVNNDLPNDAIGKTNQISGAVTVKPDGTIDSANSKITVDVTSLKSDRDMRDNFVRRNVLNTSQYPQVVFVPTQVSGLPSPLPQSGDVAFKVTGDLTVRDVTKPVTWDVTGTINGDQATGKASTTFKFEDFNLQQPRVPVVLSLEDRITLEVNVTLQKNGATSAIPNTGNTTAANTPALAAAPASANAPATTVAPATADASAPDCTSPAAQTPAATEGPYFKAGSPEQGNLIQQGMSGTQLTLTGYVLTTDCKPIPHALLDFWQADAQGQYDNSGYTLRGHQYTDAAGRYQLVTVIPGLYPGRTEHIHVKVQPPTGAVLTTQLFFPDVSQNQRDGIFDPHLLVNLQDAPDGKQATFNFVVGG